jgi:putative tryptophan/tyrosine transport system substrate-binding protein
MIGRREFVAGLGGAAAWPVAMRAQQGGALRRVGVLMTWPVDDPYALPWITAFVQGLQEFGWTVGRNVRLDYRWGVLEAQQRALPVVGYLFRGSLRPNENLVAAFRKGLSETGYVEGRNVAVEYRFAEGHIDRLPALASDLVRQGVAVIATPGGTATVQAAKTATSSIPIVFEVGTVEDGLVPSFNRPGGNVTGVTAINAELTGKRLGLLRDVVPKAARIGVLIDSNSPFVGDKFIGEINAAGAAIGRQIDILLAGTIHEVDGVFASLLQKRIDALLVYPSPVFAGFRVEMTTLAARLAVPAMYWDRIFAEVDGLISYGTNGDDQIGKSASTLAAF